MARISGEDKVACPTFSEKTTGLVDSVADNIPALIKMIIAVVRREKCSTTGKGRFKYCGQEFPAELFM